MKRILGHYLVKVGHIPEALHNKKVVVERLEVEILEEVMPEVVAVVGVEIVVVEVEVRHQRPISHQTFL